MKCLNVFTFRLILSLFAIVGVLWISPGQLFSQTAKEAAAALPSIQNPPPASARSPSATTPALKTPAQNFIEAPYESFKRPSLITQGFALSLLSLLPFMVMILTSFLKIVVVLSLLRSALGAQQAPPNAIINGVAFMLSLFIMYPTGLKMYDASREVITKLRAPESITSTDTPQYVIEVASAAREPLREFFRKNSSPQHQALFYRMVYTKIPEEFRATIKPDDFMVLVPSFITSQLKDAFEIGVLIYVPFFVIDLVTSNVLLAMGMMMLSPVTISMPLKLFLLVMLDGWTLLIEGLVNTFIT